MRWFAQLIEPGKAAIDPSDVSVDLRGSEGFASAILGSGLAADQRWNDLDGQGMRHIQRGVVNRMPNRFRKDRIVLRKDRQIAAQRQFGQHRLDQDAGGAIALDDGNQALDG
jgi:hypothetical protein